LPPDELSPDELPPDELPPDELPPDELPPALAGGTQDKIMNGFSQNVVNNFIIIVLQNFG
jgi:hypothetical protein